ncbi:type IV pilus assembly protein PilM [Patescibacteria group bacterium]|nr:type IV pilus assembly protein PilM [Patescibacteria group bacterium]
MFGAKKKINAFGLDLSDRSIKVAQLQRVGDKMDLYSYGRQDLEEGIVKNGEILDRKKVIDAIKKTVDRARPKPIKSKFVVYSIPESKGFIRVIKIPYTEEKNIEQAVRYEAEQLFPIDTNESYIDWQVMSNDNKEMDVIVALVPRILVDSYSSVIREVGLVPIVAEIESIAITRSLINKNQSERPILVIDLGKDRTSFIIFKNPSVQFTASIPVCGEEFITAIAKNLKINKASAEDIKRRCGLKLDEECKEVFKSIQPSLHEMINYINKLTYYYKEHFTASEDIAKVIICGGEAKMIGISSFLSLQIKKEIEKGNPWINIIKTGEKIIPPISRDDSLVFVTVLGLAIRALEEF